MNRSAPLLALLLVASPAAHAEAGESGFAVLKIGPAGRGMAMGEAMTAHVSGAAATHYNPAALLHSADTASGTQLMLTHREWIEGSRTEFLGASIGLGPDNAFGIALTSTTVSDIEIRTRPGEPEGTFTARSFSLGGSYAHRIDERLLAGATLRFLYEKILVDDASGFAVDLGVRYRTEIDGLSVGAALANLGSGGTLHTETTTLPALLRAGAAYEMALPGDTPSRLTVAADVVHLFPGSLTRLNAGAEFLYNRLFALRAGYQFGGDIRGLSAGLGVLYSRIGLDYAFSPLGEDFGGTHTLSLFFNL